MLRSLYAGVSGMKGFQTKMDVISNNIANVNTYGFKSGRVKFQDMLSQTIANAQSPGAGLGGVNPQQVGLGVRVGSIDILMGGGALQPTNRDLDFAIEGEGFFVLQDGAGNNFYTRDGSFFADHEGNLTNANGLPVMGYDVRDLSETTGTGVYDGVRDTLGDIPIKEDLIGLQIYQKVWFDVDNSDADNPIVGDILFDPDSGNHDLSSTYELQEFHIDATGKIVGIYSSQEEQESITVTIGYVAVSKFKNPEGLTKAGNNNYARSNNSGESEYGQAGEAGYGYLRQRFLEMSNVDLANEFTEMIVTSRAYQANSRSITTSDEMLQELLSLKR